MDTQCKQNKSVETNDNDQLVSGRRYIANIAPAPSDATVVFPECETGVANFSRPTVLNFITYPRLTYPNFCLNRDGLTPAGGKIVGPGICPPVRGQLSLKDFF